MFFVLTSELNCLHVYMYAFVLFGFIVLFVVVVLMVACWAFSCVTDLYLVVGYWCLC